MPRSASSRSGWWVALLWGTLFGPPLAVATISLILFRQGMTMPPRLLILSILLILASCLALGLIIARARSLRDQSSE